MAENLTFNDGEYALSVWTPEKIAVLEKSWNQQKEKWYELLNPLVPSGNGNVLDAGCGVGAYHDLLTRKAKTYVGVDITDEMIKRARERFPNVDFRVGSVFNLPFPDESFDLVYCWSILIHLPYNMVEKAIRELWRTTRKHLFFNLYISLKSNSFSVKGPWDEYLTANSEEDVKKILSSLQTRSVNTWMYEPVELLEGKEFQRKIYLLWK